jgi:hypothetical protein
LSLKDSEKDWHFDIVFIQTANLISKTHAAAEPRGNPCSILPRRFSGACRQSSLSPSKIVNKISKQGTQKITRVFLNNG